MGFRNICVHCLHVLSNDGRSNLLDEQPQSAVWMKLTLLHDGRGNSLDQQPQGAFLDVLDSATDAFQAGIALTDKVHHVAVVDWVAAAVGSRYVASAVQLALDVLQRGSAYVRHLRRHLQDCSRMGWCTA